MKKVNQLWIQKQKNKEKIILEIHYFKYPREGTNQKYLLSLKQASQISEDIESLLKRIYREASHNKNKNKFGDLAK